MNTRGTNVKLLVCTAGLCLVTGCAAPAKPLYAWDGYQPQVYAYLKDNGTGSPEEQIAKLEEAAERARAQATALPPGYRAHLAMLYSRTGQNDKTVQGLAAEKEQFPESAPFMDFLMKTFAVKEGN